jgi:hypothetical protein
VPRDTVPVSSSTAISGVTLLFGIFRDRVVLIAFRLIGLKKFGKF